MEQEPQIGQKVLTFDGKSNYLEMLRPPCDFSKNFTVEAWVKAEKTKGAQRIFSQYPSWGFGLFDSLLRLTLYKRKNYTASSAEVAAGTWVHLAVVFESSWVKFYINGKFVQKDSSKRRMILGGKTCEIGRGGQQIGQYWHGQISEVRIWNKCRTRTEIQADLSRRLVGNEPGLAGYWALDEGEGAIARDKTENANHATIYGATWESPAVPRECSEATTAIAEPTALQKRLQTVLNSDKPTIAPDRFQFVLMFDGEDDWVTLGDEIDLRNTSFTIEFWSKRGSYRSNNYILSQGRRAIHAGLHIGYWFNNQLIFSAYDDYEKYALADAKYSDLNWHHWACVWDGIAQKKIVYCDGIKAGESPAANPEGFQGSGELYLGTFLREDYQFFPGYVTELRIWNRDRAPEEVQNDMHRSLAGNEPGLIGYWPLNEGSGSTVYDKTARAHHGTIHGAMWHQPSL